MQKENYVSEAKKLTMKIGVMFLLLFFCGYSYAQKTDVSLFMKKDKDVYLNEVASKSGNMFTKVGHHGPAIENHWFGLRIYFNKKGAIDVYSKGKPGLELRQTSWYPTKAQQKSGWGSDYYKVGKSLGLGGIKLWDGEKLVPLNPVDKRTAKVQKEEDRSYMEMLSEGVLYKGKKVNILVRVTVYNDSRNAKIEVIAESDELVQFATGINYHKGLQVQKSKNYIATWGIHPEDVAIEKVEVGAAILFDEQDIAKQIDDGAQHLLISKPTRLLETQITTANEKESDINSFERLLEYLNKI